MFVVEKINYRFSESSELIKKHTNNLFMLQNKKNKTMKVFATLLLLSMTITVSAQNVKSTLFGFKVGLNNSVINGVELDGDKTGFVGYELYGGFFSNSKLNDKFNLENELLFSYTDEYVFIEIPIHLKYNIYEKWSVLMGSKMDIIPNELNGHEIKPMGISAEIGVQYDINKKFFAELRTSKGLTKQVNDLLLEIHEGKRNTYRFGLGINF